MTTIEFEWPFSSSMTMSQQQPQQQHNMSNKLNKSCSDIDFIGFNDQDSVNFLNDDYLLADKKYSLAPQEPEYYDYLDDVDSNYIDDDYTDNILTNSGVPPPPALNRISEIIVNEDDEKEEKLDDVDQTQEESVEEEEEEEDRSLIVESLSETVKSEDIEESITLTLPVSTTSTTTATNSAPTLTSTATSSILKQLLGYNGRYSGTRSSPTSFLAANQSKLAKRLLSQIESVKIQTTTDDFTIYASSSLHQNLSNVEEQATNSRVNTIEETNKRTTLDLLIDVYNSELDYIRVLKKAFEIYAEPLRKFTSITHDESHLLFSYLEPIISLSYNLSIKLEKLIKSWPSEIGNSGKLLFGKKLFQSYDEYLAKYPNIIKLLDQKLKENEIREFCKLRQTNSDCSLPLKDILSLPLERIEYYEKVLKQLKQLEEGLDAERESSSKGGEESSSTKKQQQKQVTGEKQSSRKSSLQNAFKSSPRYSHQQRPHRFSLAPAVNFYRASGGRKYEFARKRFSNQYDQDDLVVNNSTEESSSLSMVKSSGVLADETSTTTADERRDSGVSLVVAAAKKKLASIPSSSNSKQQQSTFDFSSPSLVFWQKMKEKSQSLINLNNQQQQQQSNSTPTQNPNPTTTQSSRLTPTSIINPHPHAQMSSLGVNSTTSNSTSLAHIQDKFPNDDLKLFEQHNRSSSSSASKSTSFSGSKFARFFQSSSSSYSATAAKNSSSSNNTLNTSPLSLIKSKPKQQSSKQHVVAASTLTTVYNSNVDLSTTTADINNNNNKNNNTNSKLSNNSSSSTNTNSSSRRSSSSNNNNNKDSEVDSSSSSSSNPNTNTNTNELINTNNNNSTTTSTTNPIIESSTSSSSSSETTVGRVNNNSPQRSTPPQSFVSKHLLIQRRKTIHDIINLDSILNTLTIHKPKSENSPSQQQQQQQQLLTSSTISSNSTNSTTSSTSVQRSNTVLKSSNKSVAAIVSAAINAPQPTANLSTRELLKQGPVLLLNQYGKQDRYLFLFNDLLIIAKQKNENHNKLKHRVVLNEIWIDDSANSIASYFGIDSHCFTAESSFVIGWPPATNYIVDFKDTFVRDDWFRLFKELIEAGKRKDKEIHLNIKISFNRDTFGASEPTQYSQSYTKTIQVKSNETAQEIVNRCKSLFNLDHPNELSSKPQTDSYSSTTSTCDYQLWLKTDKNEPLVPLIGHEYPFAIKMNYLRESTSVGGVGDDTNSCKFILIDKNSPSAALLTGTGSNIRLASTSSNGSNNSTKKMQQQQSPQSNNKENSHQQMLFNNGSSNLMTASANSKTSEPSTVESSTTTNSSGGEKMQKLFKKKAALFWTTNHQTNSNSNSNSSALKSSQQNINNNNIESSSTTINQQNKVNSLSTQHINKIETHKKNSFERDLYRLHHHPNSMLTHANRSNSLHYVSGLQQNAAPNPAASTTTTLSYRASSKPPTSESNATNKPSSLPFYNRLKKVHHSHAPHLFGSRLEKICGPFHLETNCRLPSSIMSLMEKVAVEGASSLMIFRKSASAKLKKTYKDKLDTNSAVDFNDMNVHVAALLLKEYMREYPDGIVDYHVYTDCMQSATSSGSNDTAASTTHRLKTTRHLLSTRLSKWNYTLLRHFMCLFAHIASHAHLNKMDAHNISVCVAPSMFHKLDRPNDVESSFKAIAFVEFLINNIEALFGPDTLSLLPSSSVSSSDNPQQEIVIQPAIQPQPAYTQEPVNEPAVAKTTGKAHQTKKEFGGRVLNLVGLKSRTVKSTRSVSKSSSKSNKPTATVAATTPAINQVQSAVDTKNETHDFDDGLRPINRDENEENDQLRSTDMDFKFKRHFNNHNVEKRRRTSTNISTNKSNTAAETVVGMREQQTPQLQQQQPPKLVIEIDHEEERIVAESEEKTRRFKSVTTRGNDDQLIGEHDEVDVDIIEDDEDIDDDGIDDDDDDNELFQKVDVSLKKRPSNKNKTSTMESTSGGGETTRWLSVMAAKRASAQTKDSTANVSSNTLSADSGVSVPVTTTATSNGAATTTATNNDLSSLSNHHRRSNAESSSTSSQNNSSSNSSSNENLLAACGGSSNALPSSSSSTSSSTSSQHYLRRQKRMMALFAATNESSSVASHPPPIPSPPQRHYDDEEEEIEDDDDEDDEVVDEDEDLTDLTKPSNEVVSTAAPNHIDVHSSVNSHYYHRLLPQKQQSNPIQPTSQRNHLNLMKQFSESDALYLDYSLERSSDNNSSPSSNTNDHHNHHENNNNEHYTNKNPYCSLDRCYYNRQQQKRNSIKSFAPLAPTLLLKHAEPQQQPQQMTLVPYETEHVPVNYLRAVEQSTTYNYLSLQLEHRHSKQEQKQKQAPKLDSLVTSASSLLDSKSTSTNPATKSAKSNRTSRRSVVKISLEPSSSSSTSSSSMLFMDAVHTGLGLAANSIGVNTSLGSSSSNNTTTTTATTNTASQHSSSTNSSSSSLNIVINEDKSSPSTSSTSQHQQSSSKVYITYSPNSTSQKQAVAKNPILSNSTHSSLVINTTNKLYPERNARVDQIAQIGSTNASNTMIVKRSVSLRNERPFGSNPFKYNHMFFSNNSRALNEEEGNSTAQTAAETATKVLPPTSYGNNAQQHHHRFISKVYSNIAASPHQHPNCGLSDRVFEKHSASSSRIQQHHDLFAGFLPSRLNQANPTTTAANNNTGGSFNNKSKMVADHLNNAIHSATSIISTSSTSSVSSVTSISNQGNIKQSHLSESTKQPQQSSSSTLNLVDVTWSVPHIRKQFEEKAQQQQQQDNSTNEFSTSSSNSTMSLLTPTASQSSSGFKLVKINRSNTVRAAASGTVTTSTTTTSSSVDHQSTGFIRFYNDINGNPTTYI